MKPIVIKIGTGVLTREIDGKLDRVALTKLVTAVADLVRSGQPCVLVSSGAVGAGISQLGLNEYPSDVPTRQACAAVGQTRLMHAYENLFNNFELNVAQLLLTADDFRDSARRVRVEDTLERLSKSPQIIPIINENDSVAVEELSFGDNDMLSARVAALIGASQLILLSNIDGLLAPESTDVVEYVENVDDVLGFIRADKGKFSIGGMASKLKAVRIAVDAGIETVVAHGKHPERLDAITQGAGLCTRFQAR
ncbi:glutamate 5-kinase [Rubritalea profundi]|uniref:Glutamate 5-kinase n=1 Tax=Rubritalea profundi TaxID=1658618 RepID=A0A2S7TYR0_9BACT|nr:glutamate 5-kinase [Rubritalea profundi]PQJ27886.1 glutamate 5-kinase [Rubritalea profundi]